MADISIPSLDRTDTVDWENVQGDVILRLPKTKEEFVFFVIENPKHFKAKVSQLNITTTGDVHRARERIREAKKQDPACLIPLSGLNIAFSQKGLHALGIKDDLGDVPFSHGQLLDAEALGDDGVQTDKGFEPNWERAFTERIDGVLLATGETLQAVHDTVKAALETLGVSVEVVYRLKGSVRPGDQRGHEHFGWNDGISNPAVKNVGGKPLPGQRVVPPGVILLGKEQDPVKNRPSWAVEGSFMVFRQLSQLVPEFHDFLEQNPLEETGPDRERGSELLGARLFGRWKSGAPLICAFPNDDPELAKDKCKNNDFEYPTETGEEGQTRCPYSAHIRKMNPRNELELAKVERGSMVRTGIAYGPEVSPNEKEDNTTEYERGLAFVCYQSSLQVGPVSGRQSDWGFRFVQRSWANTVEFPRGKGFEPGWDPIIGQDNGRPRNTLGTSKGPELVLPQDFVVSRGGEYFFTPSIHALKTILSGIDG